MMSYRILIAMREKRSHVRREWWWGDTYPTLFHAENAAQHCGKHVGEMFKQVKSIRSVQVILQDTAGFDHQIKTWKRL